MKLHRIFALLLCLAALAFAGAQAEPKPGIYVGEEPYTFIRDKAGNIDLEASDIYVVADDAEKAEIVCSIYQEGSDVPVFGPEAVAVSEEGKIGRIPTGRLSAECEYRIEMQFAEEPDSLVKAEFAVSEFVIYKISEKESENLAVFSVDKNRYDIVMHTDASDYMWNFSVAEGFDGQVEIELAENFEEINRKNCNDFDGKAIKSNMSALGDDGEKVVIFYSGDNYKVVYLVRAFDNEADFEAAIAEYPEKKVLSDDADMDIKADNTKTPEAENTSKPENTAEVKATQNPDADTTKAPANDPTTEPTAVPTPVPATEPTAVPTAESAAKPTAAPTAESTAKATAEATAEATAKATAEATIEPTAEPSEKPTDKPSAKPTEKPDEKQTPAPTQEVKTKISAKKIEHISDKEEAVLKTIYLKSEDGIYNAEVYAGASYRISGTYTRGAELEASYGILEMDEGLWSVTITNISKDMEILQISDCADEDNMIECRFEFIADEAEVSIDPVHEGDDVITGITDPNSYVRLYIGEDPSPEAINSDDDGKFEFSGIEVSAKEEYRLHVTNMYSNECEQQIKVLPYDGDDDITITLSSSCGRDDSDGEYSDDDIADLKIHAVTAKEAEIALYISRKGEKQRELLGSISTDTSWLSASVEGSLPIGDYMEDAEDGAYEITAEYVQFSYNDYASQPLVIVKDNTAPDAPVIESVKDDAVYLNFSVAEKCTVTVYVDGEFAGEFEAKAGSNNIGVSDIGTIEYGTEITVTARDNAGNVSGECIVKVSASDRIGDVVLNVMPEEPDESDTLVITGRFGTVDENVTVKAVLSTSGKVLAEIEIPVHKAENAGAEGDYNGVMEYRHEINDLSWLGIDRDIDVKVTISVDGEDESVEKSFKVAADYSLLVLPLVSFVMIAAGLAAAIIAFVKVTQRIANLKKAALDSENDSNLTIRRRGYDRAVK